MIFFSYFSENQNLQRLSANPLNWTVDEVINYIVIMDPDLGRDMHLFKKHRINGKSLFYLNTDIMTKNMELRCGPAVKLNNKVIQL